MSQIHDLASGRLAASAFLALAIAHGSATAQYQAFVDEATKITFNIPKQENTDRCNIQISSQGSQPIEQVVEGPNFTAAIELTPNQVGDVSINWVGKTRFRGLRSVVGCVGQGQIIVSVVPSTPQIEAAWTKVFSEMTAERRECVEVGLTRFSIKWQVSNPTDRIVGPYHQSVMPIYQRCDRFDRSDRAWKQWQSLPGANGSQFNYPCVIEGKSTRCDGFYAERMPSGELNEISRTAAISNHMAGRSWTTGQRENNEARVVRETAEAKAETERKKAEAERILAKAEADRLKLEAEERERKWKESPEYKKQQAELEERMRKEREQAEETARLQREERARRQKEKERMAQEQRDILAKEYPYYAMLTCGISGNEHINTYACFVGKYSHTNIELRNGDAYGLYGPNDISRIGNEVVGGFKIDLRGRFAIKAQNADDLVLGIRIYETKSDRLVFEKQVAKFGVILVRN